MEKFKKIIAIFLSMQLFVVLILFTILSFISNLYNKDYYTNIFKNIDLNTIELTDIGIDEEGTVEDYIVEEFKEVGLEEEVTRNIVRNDEIKEVIGEFMADYVNYVSTGENLPQVKREDVEKVLNNEEVKNAIDRELTDKEKNDLINMVNDMIKKELGVSNNE